MNFPIDSRPSLFAPYRDRRIAIVILLGFASGLPLALVGATLSARLFEAGVTRGSIGLFAIALVPYSLKWAWAPLVDRLPLPPLTTHFGRRRGWLIAIQFLLAASLVWMGSIDEASDLATLAVATLVTCFFAASQDVVIDALRIELLDPAQQGAGAAASVLGYRLGMLTSSAGALYLATYGTWRSTYFLMASFLVIGFVTVLCTGEPSEFRARSKASNVAEWLRQAVVEPFADFASRRHWFGFLAIIVLYKIGDALLGVMHQPFYLSLGFSKIEIANASKIFGVVTTIVGTLVGGAVVARLRVVPTLLGCGVFTMLALCCFAWLASLGKDFPIFYLAIGIDNFARGMGDAAFLAFLAQLCNRAYTATQYALLSALAAVMRDLVVAPAGFLAERIDWVAYFLMASAATLPSLLLILWLRRDIAAATERFGPSRIAG